MRTRIAWVVAVALGIAAVAAAVLLGGRQSDGATWHDASVVGESTSYSAPIPLGEVAVDVQVATRATRAEAHDLKPPLGGRMVEVGWAPSFSQGASVLWPGASVAQRQLVPVRLELVTEDRVYPVAQALVPSDEPGSKVIAVDGEARDVRVRVVAPGRTTLAVPAPASPKPTDPPAPATFQGLAWPADKCDPDGDLRELQHSVTCSAFQARSAYVPGLGWAPAGQDWFVMRGAAAGADAANTNVKRSEDDYVSYTLTGTSKLTVEVQNAQLVRRSGQPSADAIRATLEDRAYLVPVGQKAQVRFRYHQDAVLAQHEIPGPGKPQRVGLDVDVKWTI